jgi:hypothetical protein
MQPFPPLRERDSQGRGGGVASDARGGRMAARQRNDKIHPNNPVLRNPRFAQLVFDEARRPIVWLFVSRRLRKSARAIWKEEEPIVQRYSDWAKTGDPSEVGDPLKAPAESETTRFACGSICPGVFRLIYLIGMH